MNDYKLLARNELVRQGTGICFRDHYGFVVDYNEETKGKLTPTTLGEACLHTAIAGIAIATGNYSQDEWEKANANQLLIELLNTLLDHGWGNKDNLGREQPIRHPDWLDFNKEGVAFRRRPLSRDSFAPIIAAIYYAFKCPNSNEEVRSVARKLAIKWAEYLVQFQWKLHSLYIEGEFDEDGDHFKNIFSDEKQAPTMYLGPDAFLLWPHDIFAFQNVASAIGIPAVGWQPWANLTKEIESLFVDFVAPYLGDLAKQSMEGFLDLLDMSIPYRIPLGTEDWNLGIIKGSLDISIPEEMRKQISDQTYEVVTPVLREIYRLRSYFNDQANDIIALIINRILDQLPEVLGKDTWRTIFTDALQKVVPWLTGTIWAEAGTFLVALVVVKKQEVSAISYTCWATAAECETRIEVRELIRPAIEKFFNEISQDGNPNGLWAWLAEATEAAGEQLELFESNDHRHWDSFAYGSTTFDKWAKESNDQSSKKSPRIDYLVIDGLLEKGSPPGLAEVAEDWLEKIKQFIIEGIINKAKDEFNNLGYYTIETLNEAGELLRKTWTKALDYTEDLLKDGKIVDQKVFNQAGKAISHWAESNGQTVQEYWNRSTEKYWKGVWKDVGDASEMIERKITGLDDLVTEEYWNRVNEKYWKGTWRKVGEEFEMISRSITGLDDLLTEEYWNRASEKHWKGTWKKVGEGFELIEREIKGLDDLLTQEFWNRANEKYSKTIWKQIGNEYEKLERTAKGLDDLLTEEYWNRANEKYWKGTWKKVADGYDMIERKITKLDDVLTEEYWNRGAEKYWKGTWKKVANEYKMIERVIRLDDQSVKEVWNDAGEWGKKVFDKAGKIIEESGIFKPSIDLPDWLPNLPISGLPKIDSPVIKMPEVKTPKIKMPKSPF